MAKLAVSPTLDSRNLDRHFQRDSRTQQEVPDIILQDMRIVMSRAREKAQEMIDSTESILANAMQTRAKNAAQARERNSRIDAHFQAEFARIERAAIDEILSLEKRMTPPKPADVVGQMREMEIRAAFAALPSDKRKEALNNGSDDIVHAILNSPPMLTGMSKAEHEMALHNYKSKRFGPELDRIKRIEGAREDMRRGALVLNNLTNKLTDEKEIEAAQRSEQAAQAALNIVA